MIYAGLEKNALFTQDKKIPFQWIQPGNTGNTGGGSSKPHGTTTWTPGPNGTVFSFDPKPNYDNSFVYSVLPYPATPPKRMRFTAGNWSSLTPGDWIKSQQMEGAQKEYVGGGFKYTCCWAVNPRDGLQYWAGAKNWQPFKSDILSMANPIFWMAEFSLDLTRHVYRYDWIVINGEKLDVGIEVPAMASAHSGQKEYSVAVQLDGNKAGDAYSGLLNNLVTEWA